MSRKHPGQSFAGVIEELLTDLENCRAIKSGQERQKTENDTT